MKIKKINIICRVIITKIDKNVSLTRLHLKKTEKKNRMQGKYSDPKMQITINYN